MNCQVCRAERSTEVPAAFDSRFLIAGRVVRMCSAHAYAYTRVREAREPDPHPMTVHAVIHEDGAVFDEVISG